MSDDKIDWGGWRNRACFMRWVNTYHPRFALKVEQKLQEPDRVDAQACDILAEVTTERTIW